MNGLVLHSEVAVFSDGRFGAVSNYSMFYAYCNGRESSIASCYRYDTCATRCYNGINIGISCYGMLQTGVIGLQYIY